MADMEAAAWPWLGEDVRCGRATSRLDASRPCCILGEIVVVVPSGLSHSTSGDVSGATLPAGGTLRTLTTLTGGAIVTEVAPGADTRRRACAAGLGARPLGIEAPMSARHACDHAAGTGGVQTLGNTGLTARGVHSLGECWGVRTPPTPLVVGRGSE